MNDTSRPASASPGADPRPADTSDVRPSAPTAPGAPTAPTAPSARSAAPLPPPPLAGNATRYAGLTVLVVGGAHGIGAGCAERYAAEGASVVVADLEPEAAQRLCARLPVLGDAAHLAVEMDVTDRGSVDAAVARAAEHRGRIDALAHVAGINADHAGPDAVDDEVWTRLLDIDLIGPVRTIRATIPHLRASEQPAIVLVSSVNGMMPIGGEPYSAAKAGLNSLVENLAVSLSADGIRVTAIAPGTVRTRSWPGDSADSVARLYPLRRVGEPADIAAAAAFLTSREAAWITGQILPVDGGLLLTRMGPEGHARPFGPTD